MITGTGMKNTILDFKKKPALFVCSSKNTITSLVESSKSFSKSGNLVLLFDYNERAASRALPAFVNASIRFADGVARSGSMQVEMLLMLCGTMNIGKALRECGAKSSERFAVFASDAKLFAKFRAANGISKTKRLGLTLNPKEAGNVAITELLND